MSIDDWKYYNHAMIPNGSPHEVPDLNPVINGAIWAGISGKGTPIFARWTEDFDCAETTNWWYVIKDTAFDIAGVKAKRRYEINKGMKHFEVRLLSNPSHYAQELCDVQIAAFSAYPAKYRPTVDRSAFVKSVSTWCAEDCRVYGAFSREDNQLCGYALLRNETQAVNFQVLKTRPESEKFAVNAAIVYKILQDHRDRLNDGCYIYDGERSMVHETAFQDYLEKYFGFRKAYCRLNLKYNPKFALLILILYRFRTIFQKFDHIGIVHKMNAVFAMQEIVDNQKTDS